MKIMKQYLLLNFLLFEIYGQEVGGPIHCWFPQPKSWGTSLPRSLYGCCAYAAFGNKVERSFVLSTKSKQIERVQFISTVERTKFHEKLVRHCCRLATKSNVIRRSRT